MIKFIFFIILYKFCQSEVIIKPSTIDIIYSETLPGNLLPNFLFQQGQVEGGSVGVNIGGGRGTPKPFLPDDSCDVDIFEGAMEDERGPQLPYLTQDQWTCDRNLTTLPTWIMESESLMVTITPQFAGKVWGIYDKRRGQELLFNNRAHQPANIAVLKAWASGGAEWNWSPGIIGHSAFSETQVYLAQVDTDRGPMLRVYEFDRRNGSTWQVDMMLVNDTFIIHPRISNPTEVDLKGYWWTCVAVPATPSTRILSPATHVAETSRGAVRKASWPRFADAIENASFTGYQGQTGTDNSFLGNHQLGDMFLRIPDTVYTPYIGHTEDDGYVLVHGHPLNGTKFFTWGQSGPGRFMQDFLAGGGKRLGDYTELQVGPAPTQMQTFPLPKNSQLEWTEWFKGFQGSASVLRGQDYQAALTSVDNWIRSSQGMPQEKIEDWDAFFKKYASVSPSEILVQGQPWGYVEQLLLNEDSLVPGLTFAPPSRGSREEAEAQPWIELVRDGTFSNVSLSHLPLSFQTTDRWLDALQRSVDTHGLTWLHALHIGIALAERGVVTDARVLFNESFTLRANAIAARCLAVLSSTPTEAWPFFQLAWSTLMHESEIDTRDRLILNLGTEISFFLQQQQWFDEIERFIALAPPLLTSSDAFVTMQIKYQLYAQDFEAARNALASHCFPTYASARSDLMNMWNAAVEGIAQQQKQYTLTAAEKHVARMADPVPDNIGCQYASEYCLNYW